MNVEILGLSFKWQELALYFFAAEYHCCRMKYSSPFFAFSFASLACSLPPLAPPAAGHITSIEELSAYFSSVFGSDPHTVLLFLQAKVGLLRRTLPFKQVDVGDLNDFYSMYRVPGCEIEASQESYASVLSSPVTEFPHSFDRDLLCSFLFLSSSITVNLEFLKKNLIYIADVRILHLLMCTNCDYFCL